MDWIEIKRFAGELPLSKDALHIYAGLSIQLASCCVTRKSLSSIFPWSAVLVLQLINEGLDLLLEPEQSVQRWQIDGSVHDTINTMALPTILLILVRYAPGLFRTSTPGRDATDPPPN